MSITSVSSDRKQSTTIEDNYKLRDTFSIDDNYMRKYDPILDEWFIVEIPKPISRMVGQIPNKDTARKIKLPTTRQTGV